MSTENSSPTAMLVKKFVNRTDKKQAQISEEIGLPENSNALSLFKSGKSQLPLSRSVALADSCGCSLEEKQLLVGTCMHQFHEAAVNVLEVFEGGSGVQETILKLALSGSAKPTEMEPGYV
jgi:hypothetical protein